MEVVFWLVLVALFIVLILVLLRHEDEFRKRPLTLIEPLGTIITSWRVVRTVGSEPTLRQLLSFVRHTNTNRAQSLELITASLDWPASRDQAVLVQSQLLGVWGEQRVVRHDRRQLSIVVGSATEVLPLLKYRADGKTVLQESEKTEALQTATTAAKHGYLVLAVGSRAVHGPASAVLKDHSYQGLILLEPIIKAKNLPKLSVDRYRILSPLPTEFLSWLWEKMTNAHQEQNVATPTNIQEQERFWENSPVIGAATLEERHQAIRFLQRRYRCSVISSLEEDQRLPND